MTEATPAIADLTGVYRVLACPQEADDRLRHRLLDRIEPTYAQQIARRFIAVNEAELVQRSTGLCAVIADWCRRIANFASVWATPLADMYSSVRGTRSDPVRAATALGLHIASTGHGGTWASSLLEPVRLRWDRYLLPAADQMSVEHHGGAARVELRLASSRHHVATFNLSDDSWQAYGASALPAAGDRSHPVLLDRTALPPGCSLSRDVNDAVADSLTPAAVGAFSAALDLIANHASIYSPWVERVVRDILVLNVRRGHMRSGSNTSWPGLVYMSTADPVVLAENLVHEASHQYFHLLARIEDVDDGSDQALYYSPPTKRDRPLDAILVAYHAFANVALFLESCASLDESAPYVTARRSEVLEWVRRLEKPIRRNPALTATGLALTQPLTERLGAPAGTR